MPGLLIVRGKADCTGDRRLPGQHRYRHRRIQVGEMEGFRTTGKHHFVDHRERKARRDSELKGEAFTIT